MAVSTVIAIVADCDDTLAPDTTAQLLRRFDIEPTKFYKGAVNALVNAGYDPVLAYLNAMLRLAKDGGPLASLTRERILEIAKGLEFFPGIPKAFQSLRQEVSRDYEKWGIRLESFVISSGLEDLIVASSLGGSTRCIWGSNFGYDENGRICEVKNVVSFTEKTRFLFAIQKGLIEPDDKSNPYLVNRPENDNDENRPIPLRNMIYLGDGPSDIPCMSIIQKARGNVIGILNKKEPNRAWALGYGRRANLTVPENFQEGEHGFIQLREAVIRVADRIKGDLEWQRRSGTAPGY